MLHSWYYEGSNRNCIEPKAKIIARRWQDARQQEQQRSLGEPIQMITTEKESANKDISVFYQDFLRRLWLESNRPDIYLKEKSVVWWGESQRGHWQKMSNNIQNNNELSDKLDLINRNLRTLRIDFNETIREIIRQEFSKLLGQHLKEEAARRRERCWSWQISIKFLKFLINV